jgi:aspartate aminotransferase
VPAPYWVSYPDIALLAGGVPVFVDCPAAKGFKLQPADLERAITPRTRWLMLNSPNNPSGATYTRAELQALAEVLKRIRMSGSDRRHLRAPGLRRRRVRHHGPGGARAEGPHPDHQRCLQGLRDDRLAHRLRRGPAALVKAMVKLQSQSTSGASSIGQAAAVGGADGSAGFHRHEPARLPQRRDTVVAALNAIDGIHCHAPEGAFYVFASCSALFGCARRAALRSATSDDWIMHLLDSQNLAALQGSAYGVPSHFRLSFAAAPNTCWRAAAALREARDATLGPFFFLFPPPGTASMNPDPS